MKIRMIVIVLWSNTAATQSLDLDSGVSQLMCWPLFKGTINPSLFILNWIYISPVMLRKYGGKKERV